MATRGVSVGTRAGTGDGFGDSDEDEWSVELVDEDITDDALRLAAATAASKGDVETMKTFPQHLWKTKSGVPLLHLCAESGFLTACDHLVKTSRCPVDLRSRDEMTALHIACGRFGGDLMVLKLLSLGADSNAIDSSGWTPLHFSVRYARSGTVWLLLLHGARLEARDLSARTPRMLARNIILDGMLKELEASIVVNDCDDDLKSVTSSTEAGGMSWQGSREMFDSLQECLDAVMGDDPQVQRARVLYAELCQPNTHELNASIDAYRKLDHLYIPPLQPSYEMLKKKDHIDPDSAHFMSFAIDGSKDKSSTDHLTSEASSFVLGFREEVHASRVLLTENTLIVDQENLMLEEEQPKKQQWRGDDDEKNGEESMEGEKAIAAVVAVDECNDRQDVQQNDLQKQENNRKKYNLDSPENPVVEESSAAGVLLRENVGHRIEDQDILQYKKQLISHEQEEENEKLHEGMREVERFQRAVYRNFPHLPDRLRNYCYSADFLNACERRFKEIDRDNSGTLDIEEIMNCMQQFLKDETKDDRVWRLLTGEVEPNSDDEDGESGPAPAISMDERLNALALVNSFDADADQQIDQQEFVVLMRYIKILGFISAHEEEQSHAALEIRRLLEGTMLNRDINDVTTVNAKGADSIMDAALQNNRPERLDKLLRTVKSDDFSKSCDEAYSSVLESIARKCRWPSSRRLLKWQARYTKGIGKFGQFECEEIRKLPPPTPPTVMPATVAAGALRKTLTNLSLNELGLFLDFGVNTDKNKAIHESFRGSECKTVHEDEEGENGTNEEEQLHRETIKRLCHEVSVTFADCSDFFGSFSTSHDLKAGISGLAGDRMLPVPCLSRSAFANFSRFMLGVTISLMDKKQEKDVQFLKSALDSDDDDSATSPDITTQIGPMETQSTNKNISKILEGYENSLSFVLDNVRMLSLPKTIMDCLADEQFIVDCDKHFQILDVDGNGLFTLLEHDLMGGAVQLIRQIVPAMKTSLPLPLPDKSNDKIKDESDDIEFDEENVIEKMAGAVWRSLVVKRFNGEVPRHSFPHVVATAVSLLSFHTSARDQHAQRVIADAATEVSNIGNGVAAVDDELRSWLLSQHFVRFCELKFQEIKQLWRRQQRWQQAQCDAALENAKTSDSILSVSELTPVFRQVTKVLLKVSEVRVLLALFDADGNGELSKVEFGNFVVWSILRASLTAEANKKR